MTNDERKLVTVRTVDALDPIPDADAIEVATVGGWKCVVKKGEFKIGDRGIYFEIDSLLPLIPIFEFLRSRGTKKMLVDGVEREGYRLRTVRLRGQISQGLLMPLSVLDGLNSRDISAESLGVVKYEPPIHANLAGKVKGLFPSFIPKTDQERCQNLVAEIEVMQGQRFEVTEKLDGTSMTVYLNGDDGNQEFGVCSRNLELLDTEGNTHWRVAKEIGLEKNLRSLNRSLALQGELVGDGIQGNPYKIRGQRFMVFDIYDIKRAAYLAPEEREHLAHFLRITHVPIILHGWTLDLGVQALLLLAEGESGLADGVQREGIVLKRVEHEPGGINSFKAISNAYLLSEKQ